MTDEAPTDRSPGISKGSVIGPEGSGFSIAAMSDDLTHTHSDDEHDLGLLHDLDVLAAREREGRFRQPITRRRAPARVGGVAGAAALLAACKIEVTGGGYEAIPDETEGPYPGDGSNGPNVLTTSGVVRSDITKSFGSYSGTATGVPMQLRMKVTDVSDGNIVKQGLAVYVWHCDSQGRYSLYSSGVTSQNYLRGVQVTDANGMVVFDSIFPACYPGRWPHIHFEVYPSLAKATSAANKVKTSQIALPTAVCNEVYATSAYSSSKTSFSKVSLATDGIFRDGYSHQMANVTGDVDSGYVARLTLAVE